MDWAKTTARQDEKHLSFGIWCAMYLRFDGILKWALLPVAGDFEWCLKLHQPRLWFITGGYLVKRWFLPTAARARGQSNDLNREILASNLFNCRKEVINAPPVPPVPRCIHIVHRHKNIWEYQWSNFIYNYMSTFLHCVRCKDALLDCSAPGGERCESLTGVDEISLTATERWFSEWWAVGNMDWYHILQKLIFNSLRPEQNGWHFVDEVFKFIYFLELIGLYFDSNITEVCPQGWSHEWAIIIPLAQQSCWGVYWFHSVRPSDVRPASRVRSVVPTVLVGCISYLYILSSNFRRCVAGNVSCKIKRFEFWQFFFEFVTLTLSCFDLGSVVNH